jgi:hypothetical protein
MKELPNEHQLFYSKDGTDWIPSVYGERWIDEKCEGWLYKHLTFSERELIENPPPTNEEIINQNLRSAKALRYQNIVKDILVHQVFWQVRSSEDLVNIQDVIDEAEFQNLPEDATVTFRLADNTWRPTTAQELKEVKSSYRLRKQEIFRQFEAWDMTDKLTPFEVVL